MLIAHVLNEDFVLRSLHSFSGFGKGNYGRIFHKDYNKIQYNWLTLCFDKLKLKKYLEIRLKITRTFFKFCIISRMNIKLMF